MNDFFRGSMLSRTNWAAVMIIAFGIVLDNAQLVKDLVGPDMAGKIISGIGLLMIFLRSITTGSVEDKAAASDAGKQRGFVRVGLLPWLACAALIAILAGCAGPRARAPQSLPEQFEAANVLMERISDKLVELACTRFDRTGQFCIEPGKPLMPKTSLDLHERFIERPHTALVRAAALGPGEVADCLGAPRNANACVAAVNLLLIEADRYLIDLAAKQGGR